MNKLIDSLKVSPLIKKENYSYLIHPLTDGIPFIEPDLLDEVVDTISQEIPPCDKIVTIEAMGIPIAAVLSTRTNIPFTIIRKRKYGLPNEVEVEQKTGYSSTKLYINGIKKEDSIIIVDDVLSTGGTLVAVVDVLQHIGAKIKGIFIVVNKGNKVDIERKLGMPITTLVDIMVDDEVKIL